MLVAAWISRWVERRLKRLSNLAPSTRIGIAKFANAFLIGLSMLLGLNAAGVDLTALTVLTGAIGLGLGFGLQSIAANFVSGFVLLMDRSIKPGDVISLSGQSGTSTENFGWVQELRGRYVVVRDRDGVEMLVPNQQLISNAVINWSYTDPRIRLKLPIRVSYRDDPELALGILLTACEGQGARAAGTCAGFAADALQRQRHRTRAALLDFRSAGRSEQRALGSEPRHLAPVQAAQHHHPRGAARDRRAVEAGAFRPRLKRLLVAMPLIIAPDIVIPDEELEWKFIRSSGPGGQNVNKVASAAQLRFLLPQNASLPVPVRNRLRRLAGQKLVDDGTILFKSMSERTQEGNRRAAQGRLEALIRAALVEPKIRKKTRPTKGSQERRIESKKRRGATKQGRGGHRWD